MRKNQFLACMVAAATVFSSAVALIPVQTANAQGLTQAANAELVKYGALDNSEVELMKSLFDFDFYKAQNPDLVEILGDDYEMLFKHFCKCGVFEGRTCNPNFDPAAYASAYGDLKDLYGTDIVKYYQHYAAFGSKENRTLTTVKACADAGISVQTLSSAPVVITPQVFKLSESLGITDYTAVQAAVNAVVKFAEEHVENASENSITHVSVQLAYSNYETKADKATATAYEDAKAIGDANKAQTLALDEGKTYKSISLYVIRGTSGGYAVVADPALDNNGYLDLSTAQEVYSTTGYTAPETVDYNTRVASYDLSYSVPVTGKVDGSVSEPNYKNTAVYQFDYWSSLDRNEDMGDNSIKVRNQSGSYGKEIEETGTNLRGYSQELIGYYTDKEGLDVHKFANAEEKQKWIHESGAYSADGQSETFGLDVKGDADTTYKYNCDIKTDDVGNISEIVIAVYSDETEFGYIYDEKFTSNSSTQTTPIYYPIVDDTTTDNTQNSEPAGDGE